MKIRKKETRWSKIKKPRLLPQRNNFSPPSTNDEDRKIKNILEDSPSTSSEESLRLCRRPPFSYACLIKEALSSNSQHQLPLSKIYDYILRRYPYFQTAAPGWKNSIRHNLSLNKAFLKTPSPCEGKRASLWKLAENIIPTSQPVESFHPNQLSTLPRPSSPDKHAILLPKSTQPTHIYPSSYINFLLIQTLENPAFRNDVFLGAKTPELARDIATPIMLPNTRSPLLE